MEQQMQQALKKGQMHFLLEPIVDLKDGKIGAAMARAEWHIPQRQAPLTMKQFLPVFRKNGFIYQFDRFLFEEACKTLAKWKKENIVGLQIADLIAYPMTRYILNNEGVNYAYDVIKSNIYQKDGKLYGLKVFPIK